MATRTARKPAQAQEFIPADELERRQQLDAGRVLMTMPDPEPPEVVEPDPDDVALANVLAELGSSSTEAKVNIYQLDAQKNRAFIGAFLPSEFSMEKVQADFGPGDYEIRVYDSGRLATRKVIKIAAPKNKIEAPTPAVETGKIIETMQNGFREMATMFAGALQGLAANQPKPKTTMEMLQEMQLMREIMGANQTAAPAGPDPMQLFEMATQIAEKITPREGEPGAGEIILNAIKQFGPVLGQAVAHRQPAAAIAPPATIGPIPNAAPPVMVPVADTPPQAPQENSDMNLARKMYLNMLISNAAADNDPATYATMMLDIVGEVEAAKFANNPEWFRMLCNEEPRAANYEAWFSEMRGFILELTKPEITDINDESEIKPDAP